MGANRLRFVDLFSGIGGIRLGLETALREHNIESECVFSCEINQKSQETYALNYGEIPHADIRTVDKLPEHDVLLAGFPCQAFSYAGKQKGFADMRGTMFFEVERLLRRSEYKPNYILLENVRGFTSHDNGRTFQTVLECLNMLGYKSVSLLLNSAHFGVPQNRVRIYILCKYQNHPVISIKSDPGYSDSHKFKEENIQPTLFMDNISKKTGVTVGDVLEEYAYEKYHCSEKFSVQLRNFLGDRPLADLNGMRLIDHRGGNSIHSWELGIKGQCSQEEKDFMNALIANRRKKHFGKQQDGKKLSIEQIRTFWNNPNTEEIISSLIKKGYLSNKDGKYNPVSGNMSFEVFKFLDLNSIAITLVSSDANRLGVVDKKNILRRITPRESARLQGFPDTFILHPDDNHAYHQLGNSVSVPVISAIFSDIICNDNDFLNRIKISRAQEQNIDCCFSDHAEQAW